MRSISLFIILFVLLMTGVLYARDIDLDGIYIKKGSHLYSKLKEAKLDMYSLAASRFIDSSVIFSNWINGYTVVYIKEIKNLNVIYSFNRKTYRKNEIYRIKGAVTAASISHDEKHIVLKCLRLIGSHPKTQIIVLDIVKKQVAYMNADYPFQDYTLSISGDALYYHTTYGIIEHKLASGTKKIIFSIKHYRHLVRKSEQIIPHISPNKKKIVIVAGTAGEYRAKLFTKNERRTVPGINSATELYWINNKDIVYRRGSPGSYSVYHYRIAKNNGRFLQQYSMNTNLSFSRYPKMVSFLNNQLIVIYDINRQHLIRTPLEGEDIYFSPDGNRFVSLIYNRLYVTNVNRMQKNDILLKRKAVNVLDLYKKLLNKKQFHVNHYSRNYIKKKVTTYNDLL